MGDADAFQFLPQDTPLQVFRIDGQAGQFGQFGHGETLFEGSIGIGSFA